MTAIPTSGEPAPAGMIERPAPVAPPQSAPEPIAGEHHHEHEHRDVTGGWLRPALFGVTDGLVSNTALLTGAAGGGLHPASLVLTGLAGLAAGAFSMAIGEYTSVASQTELALAEIAIERAEIARVPQAEEAELAAIFVSRGVDDATSREVARQLSLDPEQAWRVHAREELGIDPDALPSPWLAAGSSFVAFSLGAIVPLLPFLLGATTLLLPVLSAALALFAAGALVSRSTQRTALYTGGRQLVLGAAAAALTYAVGAAVGSGV